jgi:hypothetical protein
MDVSFGKKMQMYITNKLTKDKSKKIKPNSRSHLVLISKEFH